MGQEGGDAVTSLMKHYSFQPSKATANALEMPQLGISPSGVVNAQPKVSAEYKDPALGGQGNQQI